MKKDFDELAAEYNDIRKSEYGYFGKPDYFDTVREKYLNSLLKKSNKLILEVGAGQSNIFNIFKQHKVVSLDISYEMLKNSSNKLKINADTCKLPFKNESFDAILIINVLHHLDKNNLSNLFKHYYTILNNKGQIIIIEHNPYNPITKYIVKNCSFDEGCILLSAKEIVDEASKSKFELLNKKYILFFPEILKKIFIIEKYLRNIPFGGQYMLVFQKNV